MELKDSELESGFEVLRPVAISLFWVLTVVRLGKVEEVDTFLRLLRDFLGAMEQLYMQKSKIPTILRNLYNQQNSLHLWRGHYE